MSTFRPSTRWRIDLLHAALSSLQQHWLCDGGSLTARIRARCERFSVQVLRQRLQPPLVDERAPLGIAARENAWIREVLLVANGVPQVFAHSVLARAQARGPWRMFARMGNRPLGAALFADPRIAREPLRFRRLDARHPLHRAAVQAAGLEAAAVPYLWARRSVFRRNGRALLVCEVFLPDVFAP